MRRVILRNEEELLVTCEIEKLESRERLNLVIGFIAGVLLTIFVAVMLNVI